MCMEILKQSQIQRLNPSSTFPSNFLPFNFESCGVSGVFVCPQ